MMLHYIYYTMGMDMLQPTRIFKSREKALTTLKRFNDALSPEDRDNGGSYQMASIGTSDDDADCDGDPNCEDWGCPAHKEGPLRRL
jgi:hypothetical protein